MYVLSLSALLILAATVEPGDAVTCYKCKGNVTSACGESLVNVNGIALCVGDFCLLRKYQKSGKIVRDCYTVSKGVGENKCIHSNNIVTCTCDTNHCNQPSVSYWGQADRWNGSPGVHKGITTSVLIVAVVAILAIHTNVF
ncbi:hypothetical protein NP493_31g00004 [Ridgeia piscesae]|uniref:Uncharacterized protein n=1 Tax=Ridgeia piscesae TaxID=27915 RepID=A0AAD9PCU3_RIDPI|nr:hypothetical protein NP493_31g00004 [Ridgeia piscesae]